MAASAHCTLRQHSTVGLVFEIVNILTLQIPHYTKLTSPDSKVVVFGVFVFVDQSGWKRSAIGRPFNNVKSIHDLLSLELPESQHLSMRRHQSEQAIAPA